MGFEDLHRNELEFYGIVKSIEIVGEAAYRLSKMFKERYPKTPWDGICLLYTSPSPRDI